MPENHVALISTGELQGSQPSNLELQQWEDDDCASAREANEEYRRAEQVAALLKMTPEAKSGFPLDESNSESRTSDAGNPREALLKPPPLLDAAAVESSRFVDFVVNDAEECFREVLSEFYVDWQEFNEVLFNEQLRVPHLTIGTGAPRAFGFFRSLTDYGGRTQITIDARIVFGGRRFVKSPWPAMGNKLFDKDILLHEMVHQKLAEVDQMEDKENAKHGEVFADECNRIGKTLGLQRVYTRRRSQKDDGKLLANFWPINVRPEGYYLGDVVPPCGIKMRKPPDLRGLAGLMAFFRHLVDVGKVDRLAAILRREAGQIRENAFTVKPVAEKGEPSWFNPAWLDWNGGCVALLTLGIWKKSMFDLMPLLADALEAAGCGNELLLTHCRVPLRHNRSCWVLKLLLKEIRLRPLSQQEK